MKASERAFWIMVAVAAAAVGLSGIGPRDRFTWWLEVVPVLIAVPILWATRRRFPMTPLVYGLVALHACVLSLGGHYTYAEVPAGYWVRDALGLARNHYDRLGHLMQGFVPALVAREVILRTSPLRPGRWLFTLATGLTLAISAVYEFVEWWAALILGQGADAFLGMQGDPWDTQWDMFLAFCGAVLAQALLSRLQDRQLARLVAPEAADR